MPDDVIQVINQMGEEDKSPEGIVFRNIHKELTVEDLYPDVNLDDNIDNTSDTSWDEKKHGDVQNDDENILNHDDVEDNEVNDLDTDLFRLQSGIGENINNTKKEFQYIQEGGILNKAKGQGNHFDNANNSQLANNVPLAQNDHFGGANNGNNDDGINGNNNKNQNNNKDNPNQVSDNDDGSMESYDDFNYSNVPEDNNENNHYSEDEEDDDNNIDEPEDDDQDTNDIDQPEKLTGPDRKRNRRSSHHSLPGGNGELRFYCREVNSHICPILGAMVVAK